MRQKNFVSSRALSDAYLSAFDNSSRESCGGQVEEVEEVEKEEKEEKGRRSRRRGILTIGNKPCPCRRRRTNSCRSLTNLELNYFEKVLTPFVPRQSGLIAARR